MSRRVLVARLDSVGDVILAGPAVRAIAATDGVDEVWMLCGPQGAPAARLLPGVDGVLTWSCPWIVDPSPAVTPEAIAELLSMIAELAPSDAVLLTSFHQSPLPLALLLRLAGIGTIAAASVDFAGSLLDVRLRPGEDFDEDLAEPLRALAIARAAGFSGNHDGDGYDRLAVVDTPDVGAVVGAEPYVVLHPGASVPSRRWSPERSAEAVRALTRSGFRVLVTGTSADRDLTARVAGEHGIDIGGRTDLAQMASVLRGAEVVITGNTGPAHVAAAVGTPVVSLFSPVVPASRWAPWGVPSVLLGDQDAACRGTRARECPVPGHPCLDSVTADDVVAACRQLLERQTRKAGVMA